MTGIFAFIHSGIGQLFPARRNAELIRLLKRHISEKGNVLKSDEVEVDERIRSYLVHIGIRDISALRRVYLERILKDGDICWLAMPLIGDDEFEKLKLHQPQLETCLCKPDLRELSSEGILAELEAFLTQFPTIKNPPALAKGIVEEARYWGDVVKPGRFLRKPSVA
ncbi:MAG: hypothetical protein CVT48_04295 [Thermoplasmata archaeon HGW-Thermoplasmata-1]|nr:MAG: hypothetical protein CVT48_04295 [Thermoplasmata archaeon HGW-Thermoplasmata-1]